MNYKKKKEIRNKDRQHNQFDQNEDIDLDYPDDIEKQSPNRMGNAMKYAMKNTT